MSVSSSLSQIKTNVRQAIASSWQQAGETIQIAQEQLQQIQQDVSTGIQKRVTVIQRNVQSAQRALQTRVRQAYQIGQEQLQQIQQDVSTGIQKHATVIRQNVQSAQRALQGRVRQACQIVNQKCQQAIVRIQQFISDHKMTFFLLGCSAITAYASPIVFTAIFILSIATTVEIDRRVNNYANQRLAAAQAQQIPPIPSYGNPGHTNVLEIALATVSATHAILISSFFLPSSLAVAILPPILGAAAAGHVVAKTGLDLARQCKLI